MPKNNILLGCNFKNKGQSLEKNTKILYNKVLVDIVKSKAQNAIYIWR